jgi:hypothetical protein
MAATEGQAGSRVAKAPVTYDQHPADLHGAQTNVSASRQGNSCLLKTSLLQSVYAGRSLQCGLLELKACVVLPLVMCRPVVPRANPAYFTQFGAVGQCRGITDTHSLARVRVGWWQPF